MSGRLHSEIFTQYAPRRRRGVLIPASLVAVALLMAACGGGSPSANPSPPTSPSGSAKSAGPSGPPAPVHREYPPGGPTDPVFPPGKDAYTQVAAQQCGDLLRQTQTWVTQNVPDAEGKDTTPLYMSAAYACLGQWDDALRTFGQIHTANPDFNGPNCPRTALLKWLSALIAERKKDPTFAPVFVASTAPSPCPSDSTTTSPDDTTTATSSTSTSTTASSTTTTTS